VTAARFEQLTLWADEPPDEYLEALDEHRAAARPAPPTDAPPAAITRRPAWSRRRRNYAPVTDCPDIATYRAA
jgi:hypothetical protein